MTRQHAERGLLLWRAEIHGRDEVEEAVADYGPHDEARLDRDELCSFGGGETGGEHGEDRALEGAARREEHERDVIHVKPGRKASSRARGDAEKGEDRDGTD